jgi:RNA polymerase sigma factor (sigma-70 family)
MTVPALTPVMRCLSRLAASPASDLSDADLLERFRARREEAAFTVLVQRHGPAVLGVCRRLLGNGADVDDAFQATFLVLLRKAGAIRRKASLGCWLYGVAWRLANKARARRMPSLPVGDGFALSGRDPFAEAAHRELIALLDEEIQSLSEKYRAPLILCVLEGRTYEQAARELCSSKSSLARRVEHARELLRCRLVRRGVGVPATLLAAMLAREASAAAVPALLTLATVQLVRQLPAGAPASLPAAAPAEQAVKGPTTLRWLVRLGLAAAVGLAVVAGAFKAEKAPPDLPVAPAELPGTANAVPHLDREGFPLPGEALARVGSARLRHGIDVRHLEYSPDGMLLASSGYGRLRLWDSLTGKLVRQIAVPGARNIADGFFSADGKTIVVLDGETCRWYDVRTGAEARHCDVKFPKTKGGACISARGEMFAVIDSNAGRDLVVYDLPSGVERLRKAADRAWYWPVAFSPDGKTLAAVESEGKPPVRPFRVRIFNIATGRQLGDFDPGENFLGLMFSPDGKKLLAHNKSICVWSVPDGQLLHRAEVSENGLLTAVFTPDGASVVTSGNGLDTEQLDLTTGKVLRRFPGSTTCTTVAFTPDGTGLVGAISEGTIAQWDLESTLLLPVSADRATADRPIRFSADGKLLWITDADFAAVEWQSGREVRQLRAPGESKRFLALSSDCTRIAGENDRGKTSIWDVNMGKELCALATSNPRWMVRTFSSDGQRLYTAEPGAPVREWDLNGGKELHNFVTGHALTLSLATSPDGRWLAAADHPRVAGASQPEISVWDLTGGHEVRKLLPRPDLMRARALAFSPDSKWLAAAGGTSAASGEGTAFVAVWDLRTGEEKFFRTRPGDYLQSVAFGPVGRVLVTGGEDGAVRLWEIATGQERHRFSGHENDVKSVVFSADGKLLASNSPDAAALVWDVEGCYGKRPSVVPFSGEERANLWKALDDVDASVAFGAMRRLLARPGPAMALLRERLRPTPTVSEKTLRQLLHDLDADAFAVREKAVTDLEAVADRAEPLLRKVLTDKPAAEIKRQIEHILEAAGPAAAERRRELRVVEVSERIGTAEAKELLETWSAGAGEAFLTRGARAAVERLKQR